jgi:hypothetical protein
VFSAAICALRATIAAEMRAGAPDRAWASPARRGTGVWSDRPFGVDERLASEQHGGHMAIGPIQAFIIGFPDNDLLEGRIAEELGRLSDSGQIRIIDAVFVLRDGDDVVGVSVSDLDDEQRRELRGVVGALTGLGVAGADGAVAGAVLGVTSDPDGLTVAELIADEISESLPSGSSALVLAIEHLWAAPLAEAVRDAGGIVVSETMVTPEKLIALGLELGEGA